MFLGFQVLPIYRNLYRFHKLVKGTITEDNACTTQETWRSQAGAYVEPPPLYYRVLGTESSFELPNKKDIPGSAIMRQTFS